MLTRQKERVQRRALLKQETMLYKKHCEGCENQSANASSLKRCEGCPYFEELTAIGKRILNITAGKREKKQKEVLQVLREQGLTREIYQDALDAGVMDIEIVGATGLEKREIIEWKRGHGLLKEDRKIEIEIPPKRNRKSGKYLLFIVGELIAEGTIKEISKVTGITTGTLYNYRSSNPHARATTRKLKIKLLKESEM